MSGQINNQFIPKSFYDAATGDLKVDRKTAEDVQAGVLAKMDTLPEAAKQSFLGLVAELAPQYVMPDNIDGNLDKLATAARLLSDIAAKIADPKAGEQGTPLAAFTGDLAQILGRMMIEFASEQREQASKDSVAARLQARTDLMSQAGKMEEAADKMMQGAVTNLVISTVASAISLAGSAVSLAGSAASLKSMGAANQSTKALGAKIDGLDKTVDASKSMDFQALNAQKDVATQAFNKASSQSQIFSASGQITNTLGDMGKSGGASGDAMTQSQAKGIEAEGSRDAADAQYAQQTADLKKDIRDQMTEMVKQIMNFIKEMKDAEIEAMRAITA